LSVGFTGQQLFTTNLRPEGPEANIAEVAATKADDVAALQGWMTWLEQFGVFYACPLDLDYTMLDCFPIAYRRKDAGMRGPSGKGDPRDAVLGEDGSPAFYDNSYDDALRWYRYLFLGRGKPSTHVRVLSRLTQAELLAGMPKTLMRLLQRVKQTLEQAAA